MLLKRDFNIEFLYGVRKDMPSEFRNIIRDFAELYGVRNGLPFVKKLPQTKSEMITAHYCKTFATGTDEVGKKVFRKLAVLSTYYRHKPQAFYMGSEFFDLLKEVEIKRINHKYLPERFSGYIIFPRQVIYDREDPIEREPVEGVYCLILPIEEIKEEFIEEDKHYPPGTRVLMFLVIPEMTQEDKEIAKEYPEVIRAYSRFATPLIKSLSMTIFLQPDDKSDLRKLIRERIDSMIKIRNKYAPEFVKKRVDYAAQEDHMEYLARILLNCIIYINTQKPDLKKMSAGSHMTQTQIQKRKDTHTDRGVPITLVSWDFKKPKIFHKESTVVRMFKRWQRYGKGLCYVRLRFVGPFPRSFKNYIRPAEEEAKAA